MGFLGDIGGFFSDVAQTIATGGLNIIAPKLLPKEVSQVVGTISRAQFPTSLSQVARTGLAVATKQPALLAGGGQTMALDVGGILGQVGTIFGGNQNPFFQGVSNVANLASEFFPQPTGVPATNLAAVGPAAAVAARVAGTVGRSFFNRFPNLATAIQSYRNMGKNVTRAKLYAVMKRFGPELLVSGGLLTAAAVNELMIAGPGHRRMNPGNVKALRRSLRRLESFHHLCVRVDKLRRPSRRSKTRATGGNQFVRQG
jgi:hypothetical protein